MPNEGEERVLIPSPKVPTYDLKPSMSAFEVTDEVEKRIASGKYDCIILNYANCDMVGHTGVMEAAIEAVETVDTCVGRVVEAIRKVGKCHRNRRPWQCRKMVDRESDGPIRPIP